MQLPCRSPFSYASRGDEQTADLVVAVGLELIRPAAANMPMLVRTDSDLKFGDEFAGFFEDIAALHLDDEIELVQHPVAIAPIAAIDASLVGDAVIRIGHPVWVTQIWI